MNTLSPDTVIGPDTDLSLLAHDWIYDCSVPWCIGHEDMEADTWGDLRHRGEVIKVKRVNRYGELAYERSVEVNRIESEERGRGIEVFCDEDWEISLGEAEELAAFFERVAQTVRNLAMESAA